MLAYKFAEQNQVPIPKNWSDNRRAGRDWMRSFLKRHNLSLRSPLTPQTPLKVIVLKGAKQVGTVTSTERGSLVTMIGTINAIGNTVPPYFIFPRSDFVKESMLAEAPVGYAGGAAKSGWINEESFVKYLEHFFQFTKYSAENPVLLIMDNHASHISLTASLMGENMEL